jgi:hypothetical protein
MGKYISIIVILFVVLFSISLIVFKMTRPVQVIKQWKFQSIDTMKFSRDLSREKLTDPQFAQTIQKQIKQIADTGATHVAIATPYDAEFLPILKIWVAAARANHIKVWFRGNFSGWEGWFGYSQITRKQHLELTEKFITSHPELFEDGDVFSACPECENGGPGDPRKIGNVKEYRQFLIDEYTATKHSFAQINKSVSSNYLSMNADVAKLVMDKKTTHAIDGIVTIDHYVSSPTRMISDIRQIANKSGGKIIIGEFGAPIPDIHGAMTQDQQAEWINEVLNLLAKELIGVSYWVNVGGSTQLWDESGMQNKAVFIISNHFKSHQAY